MHARQAPTREMATEDLVTWFGPEHPAVSGLRLQLTLDGEQVSAAEIELGYRHRGLEKLAERGWEQAAAIASQVDPRAPHAGAAAYARAVEALAKAELSGRAARLRVAILELERAASHLAWLANLARLLEARPAARLAGHLYRRASTALALLAGAPGAQRWIVPGGVAADAPADLLRALSGVLDALRGALDGLRMDRLAERRLNGLALVDGGRALEMGAAGPVLRATGVPHDLRTSSEVYRALGFEPVLGSGGDARARYSLHVAEVGQALTLAQRALTDLPRGAVAEKVPAIGVAGLARGHAEGPRGELSATVLTDGGERPLRVAFRGPSLAHAGLLSELLVGSMLADVPLAVASLDLSMEEAER